MLLLRTALYNPVAIWQKTPILVNIYVPGAPLPPELSLALGALMIFYFIGTCAPEPRDSSPDLPGTEPQTIRIELKTAYFLYWRYRCNITN